MQQYFDTIRSWFLNPSFEKAIYVFVGIVLLWLVVSGLKAFLTKRIKDNEAKYRVRKAFNFFGFVLVVLTIAVAYSQKLSGISIFLGVVGAGIAFALQEVIVSVAGWLTLMFSSSIKAGDRVLLGGIKGDVIDIGVLKTTIMETGEWINGDLYNGRIVSIANSFVYKEPVFNYSSEFPFLWDEIRLPVRHGGDFEFAKQICLDILEEETGDFADRSSTAWAKMTNRYRIEHAQVKPLVTLEFDENWITFTLRYVVNYKRRRITKDQLYTKLLKAFKTHSDKMSIASAAIEVTHMNPH